MTSTRYLLLAGALIAAVIVTLGAPLVPEVQQEFSLREDEGQWSYTITLLTGAVSTPLLGRVADSRYQRFAAVAVALAVGAGCVMSAVAGTFALFLAGRALQGLALSLIAMTIAAARAHLPPRQAGRTVVLLSLTTALGAGVGYPITTLVVHSLDMSAAFLGAAGFSFLTAGWLRWGLPRTAGRPPVGSDVPGALGLAVAVGCGLLAVSQGNDWGWSSAPTLVLFATSSALLGLWVWWERRATAPLVQLVILRHPAVLHAHVVALLMGFTLYSLPVLLTRVGLAPAENGFGGGLALTSIGLIMVMIAVGNLLGSRLASIITRSWGAGVALRLGSCVACAGALVMIVPSGSVFQLVAAITGTSVGAGATFGAMPTIIVGVVPLGETGSATAFNMLLRAVGGALGSAVTTALLGVGQGVQPDGSYWGYQLAFGSCACACAAAALAPLRRGRDSSLVAAT